MQLQSSFSFFMPTRVLHGQNIIQDEQSRLGEMGTRCLIVTGASSAKASGAFQDLTSALENLGIRYELFDQVEPNPSLENVAQGGDAARRFEPDFIAAIGGGSPLDAAKAIAVLAVNDIPPQQLYDGHFANTPLPIAAVPTTAGTGSEVTPYSVLTITDQETKKGFGGPDLFPKLAFLDPRYCQSLPFQVTVDTAVDALSHLVEGYLSARANDASDMLAERGMALWGTCLPALQIGEGALDAAVRDRLLVASALGGMTISHTGTAYVHSLGYPLTFYHDIPHGQANGLLLPGFLRHAESVNPDRVAAILRHLDHRSTKSLGDTLASLFPRRVQLSQDELDSYVEKTLPTKNVTHSPGTVTREVLINTLAENFSRP